MAQHRLQLTADEKRRVDQLLDTCSAKQGEYLPGHHGPGSWATTYSHDFVIAATELYQIFSKATKVPPIPTLTSTRYTLSVIFDLMAEAFNDRGIRSCRRSRMSRDTVRYLWEAHIYRRLYPDEAR